jgi:hypothetical protein
MDVRRHYYFCPNNDRYDAWDVDRLVASSRDLPVREVALASIGEVDSAYWFGADGSPPTVRILVRHMQLVEEADSTFPIILSPDGLVMDGMHRVAKALLEGRTTILSVRFEVQPEPDFRYVHPHDLPQ